MNINTYVYTFNKKEKWIGGFKFQRPTLTPVS